MRLTAVIFAGVFVGFLAMAVAHAEEAAKPSTPPKTETPQAVTTPKPIGSPTTHKKEAPKEATKKIETPVKAEAKAVLPKDVKELIAEDIIPGNGKVASKGKSVKVHYTGWLYDPSAPLGRGRQFDSSVGKEPFTFNLGAGLVIKGWDEGFNNMKVGGKRKLVIPSEMGYGARGAGNVIPPNAPLMFEVELVDVL